MLLKHLPVRQAVLPWREAGLPNHLDDKVDSDQWVINKGLSLVDVTMVKLPQSPYTGLYHACNYKERGFTYRHTWRTRGRGCDTHMRGTGGSKKDAGPDRVRVLLEHLTVGQAVLCCFIPASTVKV